MSEIFLDEFRNDGRRCHQIRNINACFEITKPNGVDGYVLLVQGNTQVMASVSGPHECKIHSEARHDMGILSCRYGKSASADINGNRRHVKRDTRSELYADYIKSIMEKVIEMNWYADSQIDIGVRVLQSDGSELAVSVNAVVLALMDAGIRMTDFVVAGTVGLYDQTVLTDLSRFEENQSLPQLTMVLLPHSNVDNNGKRFFRIYPSNRIHVSQLKQMCEAAEDVCQAIFLELNSLNKQFVARKLEKERLLEGHVNE